MGRKRTAQREVELKFQVEASRLKEWRAQGVEPFTSGSGASASLVSTYFDTEDHHLRDDGVTLRIRQAGDRRVQTVKRTRLSDTLSRQEVEAEIDGDAPDLRRIDDRELRSIVEAAGELEPLFESRIERTTWPVAYGESQFELALDDGEVVAGELRSAVCELELELKSGSVADLFGLAKAIAGTAELRLGVAGKADRGLGLLAGDGRETVKADPLLLPKDLTVAEAFQAIGRACLRHYRLNEPGVVSAREPTCLHQSRVALRRLRAAFTLFKSVLGDPEGLRLKGEVKALAKLLGKGRDLDVYLARLEAHAADNPVEPGIAEFRDRVRAQRTEAYNQIVERLCARETAQLVLDLAAWIEAGDWLDVEETSEDRDRPAPEFAAQMLERRWRKLRRKSRTPEKLEPEARHRVRIEAKKFRYAVEFFAGLFTGGKAKRRRTKLLASLEALQDTLGELNDIESGHAMATDLARSANLALRPEDPAILFAMGRFSAGQDERTATLLDRAGSAHEAIRDARPFWA